MPPGDFGEPGDLPAFVKDVQIADPDDNVWMFWGKKGAPYTFWRWYFTTMAKFKAFLAGNAPPPPAHLQAVTTATLKVRLKPGTSNAQIGLLQPGTTIMILDEPFPFVNGYSWAHVISPIDGYCATAFLKIGAPPPPPAKNKIGIHVIGQNSISDLMLDAVIRCAAAGTPLAAVTVVEGAKQANMVKALSEKTIVIGRALTMPIEKHPPQFHDEDGNWIAEMVFNELWSHIAGGLGVVDYFQFANEWLPGTPKTEDEAIVYREFYKRFCQWYYDMARIAKREGFHITIGDFSVGHPWFADPTGTVLQWTQDMYKELCTGQSNVVMYHTGSPYPPYDQGQGNLSFLAAKEDWALHFMKAAVPGTKFILGEARLGNVTNIGPDLFRSWLSDMQGLYGTMPEVIGANPFTWAGTPDNHWENEDLSHVQDTLVDFVTHNA